MVIRYDREDGKIPAEEPVSAESSNPGLVGTAVPASLDTAVAASTAPPACDQAGAPEVTSIVHLQNGMVLYLREINKYV
jgi:hypothetical protein